MLIDTEGRLYKSPMPHKIVKLCPFLSIWSHKLYPGLMTSKIQKGQDVSDIVSKDSRAAKEREYDPRKTN